MEGIIAKHVEDSNRNREEGVKILKDSIDLDCCDGVCNIKEFRNGMQKSLDNMEKAILLPLINGMLKITSQIVDLRATLEERALKSEEDLEKKKRNIPGKVWKNVPELLGISESRLNELGIYVPSNEENSETGIVEEPINSKPNTKKEETLDKEGEIDEKQKDITPKNTRAPSVFPIRKSKPGNDIPTKPIGIKQDNQIDASQSKVEKVDEYKNNEKAEFIGDVPERERKNIFEQLKVLKSESAAHKNDISSNIKNNVQGISGKPNTKIDEAHRKDKSNIGAKQKNVTSKNTSTPTIVHIGKVEPENGIPNKPTRTELDIEMDATQNKVKKVDDNEKKPESKGSRPKDSSTFAKYKKIN